MRAKTCATIVLGAVLSQLGGPAQAAEPYTIPAILPLTGGASFLGQGERRTLELMEKTVNAEGGIRGQPVKFEFQDDQSSPQLGVQLANDVIAKKPAVMIGSSLVAVCRAMAPLMDKGPVDYCLSPGIHPDKGYVFSGNVSTLDDIDALLRFFRLKGWTKIAIMTSTDATGQDAENGIRSVLARPENKVMQLVDSEHFNTTDVSVAAQIENVKASHAQAFIAWSTGTPAGTIFRDIAGAGLDLPISTTAGNMTYAQMKQYASFLPKQLYFASAQWVIRDPKLMQRPEMAGPHKKFFDAFKAAGLKPDEANDLAWDPAYILIDALRKLGTKATAAQVQTYLSHLTDYDGVDGVYNFEKVPQRGLDVGSTTITVWDPKADTWVPASKPTGIPLK
jgi:branched-chain amino acid transport system substrate-binding protein